jgi:hypothetical protein
MAKNNLSETNVSDKRTHSIRGGDDVTLLSEEDVLEILTDPRMKALFHEGRLEVTARWQSWLHARGSQLSQRTREVCCTKLSNGQWLLWSCKTLQSPACFEVVTNLPPRGR